MDEIWSPCRHHPLADCLAVADPIPVSAFKFQVVGQRRFSYQRIEKAWSDETVRDDRFVCVFYDSGHVDRPPVFEPVGHFGQPATCGADRHLDRHVRGAHPFRLPGEGWGGRRVLTWDETRDIPWGVLILFGGGLTLASAIQTTGLSDYLGALLSGLQKRTYRDLVSGCDLAWLCL